MTQEPPEYVVRKFTLPPNQDARLESLAGSHYGGNCSQCLRTALKDHARTLNNEDGASLQEVMKEVSQIKSSVEQLQEEFEEIDVKDGEYSETEQTGRDVINDKLHDDVLLDDDMYQIYRKLVDTYPEEQLLDEIVESTPLSEIKVRHALLDLSDRGKITSSTIDGTVRYTVSTDDSE